MAQTAQSKLSEKEFLRQEAEKAKTAVTQSLEQAKEALVNHVDPRELTRRHPWLAMGTAAIAAFTAVALVVPSKEEQELRRLERLRRAMNPDPTTQPSADSNGSAHKPPEKRSIGSMILHELIQLIRPVLMAAITASIKAGTTRHLRRPLPMARIIRQVVDSFIDHCLISCLLAKILKDASRQVSGGIFGGMDSGGRWRGILSE